MKEQQASSGRPLRRRLELVRLDTGPLRASPAFRRLWVGNVGSFAGSQMTSVAAAIQVYQQTHSSFLVGMVGFAGLASMICLGLFAGSVVDGVDRRRLCLITSSGISLAAAALVAQAALIPAAVWPIYLIVAVQAALVCFDTPTRRVFVPRLLPARQLTAANALFQLELNLGLVFGPLAAGGLIALVGLQWTYLGEAVLVAASIYSIARLPAMPPQGEPTRAGWSSVREGLVFLRRNEVLHTSFLVDLNAMTLAMPRALFPALAVGRYGMGAGFAGVMYAAPAVGALIGGLTSAWIARISRQGLVTLWSVAVWGALIAVFGFLTNPWLALVLLAFAGVADMISAVLRSTLLQVEVPDRLRGRMTSIYIVVVAGGPRVGELEAGAAAAILGPTAAVVAGGVACIGVTGVIAALRPRFTGYRAPPEVREAEAQMQPIEQVDLAGTAA